MDTLTSQIRILVHTRVHQAHMTSAMQDFVADHPSTLCQLMTQSTFETKPELVIQGSN